MSRFSYSSSHYFLAGIGLLSACPALYFVTGSILKYELGLLHNVTIHPFHPIILLGGLFVAMALNIYPALSVGMQRTDGTLTLSLTLNRRSWNLIILIMSTVLLTILLGYVVTENLLEIMEQSTKGLAGREL